MRWSDPVPKELLDTATAREDWFYLDELNALRHQPSLPPDIKDPERLLDLAELAALRRVSTRTMQNYVEDSLQAWSAGRDGTLPRPDDTQPAPHGLRYRWRHDRVVAWIFPEQPRRSSGRPPGRRPTVNDLRAVLADAERRGMRLQAREIAEELSSSLGVDVTTRTAQRLQAKLGETES